MVSILGKSYLILYFGIEINSWFVDYWNPWFIRGYALYHGLGAGVFTFGHTYGHAGGGNSFRVVLLFTMK